MDDKIKVKIVGIASALFFAAIVANFIPDSADVPQIKLLILIQLKFIKLIL